MKRGYKDKIKLYGDKNSIRPKRADRFARMIYNLSFTFVYGDKLNCKPNKISPKQTEDFIWLLIHG